MIDNAELCPPCVESIIISSTTLPNTLCPCEEIIEYVVPKITIPIQEYCLNSYLYNLVYQKNCISMPKGC